MYYALFPLYMHVSIFWVVNNGNREYKTKKLALNLCLPWLPCSRRQSGCRKSIVICPFVYSIAVTN